jgi:hypothetical protein
VTAKTAMLPTESDIAVDPRILLYAAHHEALLPPGSVSKVSEWHAKAETLAACFQKAGKPADLDIQGQHGELWAAMKPVTCDLVKKMAKTAALWVEKK